MQAGPCETYRRRLRWWGVATLLEAATLATGLTVTEWLDADLYGPAFTGVLLFSLLVLVPLIVTTPVSLLATAYYALKYRGCRR